jgi:two-component system NtrC family response regulator
LKNAIERAMILEEDTVITTRHLPIQVDRTVAAHQNGAGSNFSGNFTLQELEKDLLLKALKKTRGNVTRAARLLGITRDQLRYKIKKFDLQSGEIQPSL